jgi:ribose-phosphate pyrophosphokinase
MFNGVRTSKWYFYSGPMPEPAQSEDRCLVFAGSANPELAEDVAKFLGRPLDDITCKRFNDGEVSIRVNTSVRGKSVYIIQPCCGSEAGSVNDNLMELLLMVSTMRRASASKITAVIPYYGYARQDRKMESRVPISAADVASMIQCMGVDRVVCVDLHCGQIQGFFPPQTPVDNLNAGPVGAVYFAEKGLGKTVVVSPDAGGVQRAKEFRQMLERVTRVEAGVAMIIKQRSGAGKIEQMDLIGSVKDQDVIIVDDMIDTAGTLCKAAKQLKEKGARRVFAFATHGVFSGPAAERIEQSVLEEVVVSNTIPLKPAFVRQTTKKVKQLTLAPLLAETIKRLHLGQSMSALFKFSEKSKPPLMELGPAATP